MTAKAFSFGGGIQSTAALVLAAQGKLDYRVFVLADVGEDSEHPGTVAYLYDVAIPYAEANGLELHVVRKIKRDGSFESIFEKLHRTQTSIDIPVRMANGAPGNRACTADYKIKPVAKWMKQHGATVNDPGIVGVGISLDEFERMKDSQIPYIRNDYPLVEMGITRDECERIILGAGLPLPPKSSCWFCPFHRPAAWADMMRDEPELFARSVALEKMVNARRADMGKDPVWLSRFALPLDVAIPLWADNERLKAEGKDPASRRRHFKKAAGRRLPKGVEAPTIFDLMDATRGGEQHSCGPFTCTAGRAS